MAADRNRLRGTLKAGSVLTTVGLSLHFVGFGTSMAIAASEGGYLTLPLSIVSATMIYAGPVISASGASHVEGAAREARVRTPKLVSWREYGMGWAFQGGAAAWIVAAVVVAAEANNPAPLFVLIPGAIVCEVFSEIQWAKSVIHAKSFVNEVERRANLHRFSLRLVPRLDPNGPKGVQALVLF